MAIPEDLPSSVFARAWLELYKCFGERMQGDEMDLMESVFKAVMVDMRDETAQREENNA